MAQPQVLKGTLAGLLEEFSWFWEGDDLGRIIVRDDRCFLRFRLPDATSVIRPGPTGKFPEGVGFHEADGTRSYGHACPSIELVLEVIDDSVVIHSINTYVDPPTEYEYHGTILQYRSWRNLKPAMAVSAPGDAASAA